MTETTATAGPADPGALLYIEDVAELAGVAVQSIRVAQTKARAKRRRHAADPDSPAPGPADLPEPHDRVDRMIPAKGHARRAQNCPRWTGEQVNTWLAAKTSWPPTRKRPS